MPATGQRRPDSAVKHRKYSNTRQRQAQVAVRLTPGELATLRAVAARDGRSLASALREGFLRHVADRG